MGSRYIFDLSERGLPESIGNKARRLRFLVDKRFQTPATFVCTWDAYNRYAAGDPTIVAAVRSELLDKIDTRRCWAVRSSANFEDGTDHSFAGQFATVLDRQDLDQIMQAVEVVWTSAHSPGVEAYVRKIHRDIRDVKMAVMIQEMVRPVVSGVAFSKHPLTGMDEVVVEAVPGIGEALVRDGVTPRQWINKWGGWTSRPEGEEIDTGMVQEVVAQTKAIARACGQAVDLEWVYDGRTVHWVQLREITTIKNINVYSNHISKEVLPGLIKPLVWSVNVPLVNTAWVRLFTEMIGPNDLDPNSLAKSFYYRAYFNMGAIGQVFERLGYPRESLELLMGIELGGPEKPSLKPGGRTMRLLPKTLPFVLKMARFDRQIDAALPVLKAKVAGFRVEEVDTLSERDLVARIDHLYAVNQEMAYYNIVTPLLMQVYHTLLQNRLRKLGIDVDVVDLTTSIEEIEQFDPNTHLARLNRLYQALPGDLQAAVRRSTYRQLQELEGVDALRAGLEDFIREFGHLTDSTNDFSVERWRENPDTILRMAIGFNAPEIESGGRVRFEGLKIPPPTGWWLGRVHRRARRFRLYRDTVGSLWTYSYGLFRVYFLALGARLVARKVLRLPGDVFYLSLGELKEIAGAGEGYDEYAARVATRKRELEECRDVEIPSIIYGDEPPPLQTFNGRKLRGSPTSRGYYTGRTRIVRGIEDFHKLQVGDVLVIPYSDVGWTPLFAKAGAVVAESGGMLSHSSIVAREYNIPAIVSVPGACHLPDDVLVTVDAHNGEVIVHQAEPA